MPIAEHAASVFQVLHLGSGRVGRNLTIRALRLVDPPVPDRVGARAVDPAFHAHITTLDHDPALGPDHVCLLGRDRIPLPDNSIDLAVAIHVIEHIGRQGEIDEWFFFWEELYRVLKPFGRLYFESPLFTSTWAWSDPTHTRALAEQAFTFFDQDSYRIPGSAISPYRIQCDFKPLMFARLRDPYLKDEAVSHLRGILQVHKPLRAWWQDARGDAPAITRTIEIPV